MGLVCGSIHGIRLTPSPTGSGKGEITSTSPSITPCTVPHLWHRQGCGLLHIARSMGEKTTCALQLAQSNPSRMDHPLSSARTQITPMTPPDKWAMCATCGIQPKERLASVRIVAVTIAPSALIGRSTNQTRLFG